MTEQYCLLKMGNFSFKI